VWQVRHWLIQALHLSMMGVVDLHRTFHAMLMHAHRASQHYLEVLMIMTPLHQKHTRGEPCSSLFCL
jgi:hypothetical protein